MYACCPGPTTFDGHARLLVASRMDYKGIFLAGGPIERQGRLRYIDGCTSTVLLGPPAVGAPCLSHLHIPAQAKQPSRPYPCVRVGMITKGTGCCVTPETEHNLIPGMFFVLKANQEHAFHTEEDPLDVVMYQPNTDKSPTDINHPMLNNTLLID